MNYIAQCYCEEDKSSANLLDGIRTSHGDYELASVETVSELLRAQWQTTAMAFVEIYGFGTIAQALGWLARVSA